MVKGAITVKKGSKSKKDITLRKKIRSTKAKRSKAARYFGVRSMKSKKKIRGPILLKVLTLIDYTIELTKRNKKELERLDANSNSIEFFDQYLDEDSGLPKLKMRVLLGQKSIDTPAQLKDTLKDVFEVLKHLFHIEESDSENEHENENNRSMSLENRGSNRSKNSSRRSSNSNNNINALTKQLSKVTVDHDDIDQLTNLLEKRLAF